MTANPLDGWRERDGPGLVPPRVIAAGFLVVFLLGSTGVAAAVRFEDSEAGTRAFCSAYKDLPRTTSALSSGGRPDLDDPEVRSAVQQYQRIIELGRTSGNDRLEAAFDSLWRAISEATTPGTTPAEVEEKAKAFVSVSIASFQTAVAECQKAGVPIVSTRR